MSAEWKDLDANRNLMNFQISIIMKYVERAQPTNWSRGKNCNKIAISETSKFAFL